MTKLLFVVSAARHWTLEDGTTHPTGYWAEELVETHKAFVEAGFEVVIATPGGLVPTVDEVSLDPKSIGGQEKSTEYREYISSIEQALSSPAVLETQVAEPWDAIFFPGGHGPMEDLAVSESVGRLLVSFLDADKLIAALCHASAALLPAYQIDDSWAFAGYSLTGFTNQEEEIAGLADRASWLLENELRTSGAKFVAGTAWEANVVVDRNLITGQNPASSRALAQEVIMILSS